MKFTKWSINLSLFFGLVLLLCLTYYLEEIKKPLDVKINYHMTNPLFVNTTKNLNKENFWTMIKSIKFNHLEIINQKNDHLGATFWDLESKLPFSKELEDLLKDVLLNLVIVKKIEKSGNDNKQLEYFTEKQKEITLDFKDYFKGELKLTLGDVNPITGDFYFSIKDDQSENSNIYLVSSNHFYRGLYKTEIEKKLNQYLDLDFLWSLDSKSFFEKKIFYYLKLDQLKKIDFENKWNRTYTLDLQNNSIIPKHLLPLEYNKFKSILSDSFNGIEVSTIFNISSDNLEFLNIDANVIAKVKFIFDIPINQLSEATFIYLNSFEGAVGNYLWFSFFPNKIFFFDKKESVLHLKTFFLSSYQRYFNKRPLNESQIKITKDVFFNINHNNHKYNFYIKDLKNFNIETQDPKVSSFNKSKMNLFFNLLFAVSPWNEAIEVYTNLPPDFENLFTIDLEIYSISFKFIFSAKSLIIHNTENNIFYLYEIPASDHRINSFGDLINEKNS